jgi:hypothetical protein
MSKPPSSGKVVIPPKAFQRGWRQEKTSGLSGAWNLDRKRAL